MTDGHTRWFRRLLRLLPSDFQADYARDMERTFRAQRHDARSRGAAGFVELWFVTLRDLLRTAPREHVDQVGQDVSYALRAMRGRPAATLAAAATLAIGIGSVTAILSVVSGIDWRPIGYPDPDRLVFVQEQFKGEPSSTTGYATFADWREQSRSFSDMAAMGSMATTLAEGGEPEQVSVMRVTPGFFRAIGVAPALGRAFGDAENRWDNRAFVVLSDRVWRRRFASDPQVVGRTIRLGGRPYVVTGVMPPAGEDLIAQRVFQDAELWVPLAYNTSLPFACRTCRHVRVVARLRPDVSIDQAQSEVDAITQRLAAQHATSYATPGARVIRVADVVLGPVRPALYLLLTAVAVLLLIAGVNVANLLLVRSVERGPEIAIRRALGVASSRLVRQLLTESVVLAGIGAVAGVALAYAAVRALVAAAPASLPRLEQISVDGSVLGMTVAIAAGVGLLFGLVPAWFLVSADLTAFLRGARAVMPGGGRIGRALVGANVALAFVLLTTGGLLGRSFLHLLRVDPGFDASNVMTAVVPLSGPAYADSAVAMAFYQRVIDRVTAGGGEAAFTTQLPVAQSDDRAGFHVAGRVSANPEEAPMADRFAVTADFFATLRLPLLRGRVFTDRDDAKSAPVAIINRTAATQVFGDVDPIGQHIILGGPNSRKLAIVGVVGDVRHRGLGEPVSLQAYVPVAQFYGGPVTLVLRSGEGAAAASRIREAVRAADSNQAVHDVRAFEALLADTLAERRFLLWLIGSFATAALLLAVIGLYGVVSYVVAQRTRDIGLRLALGAGRADIRRLVLRVGMGPVIAGLGAGAIGVVLATRPIESMLFAVNRLDATTCAAAASVLLASALAACYLPARRATRLDPVTALRAE